nr:unnamed protein product [Spirometra erinaceieuropaei]
MFIPFLTPEENRPERRTALVSLELAFCKVDVAALSKTRFSEQGQLEEVGAGYALFWSGRPNNEQAQWLDNLLAAAASDENVPVEKRWCLLRDAFQATVQAVLDRVHRQYEDWFDDDSAVSNLLAEKNRLNKPYVDRPTDDNKAAFYRSRPPVQQRQREIQDAWAARNAQEIQWYADRIEWKIFYPP